MLQVAAFTQGIAVPSARFRVRQYIRPLLGNGIKVHEYVPRFSSYPSAAGWQRPGWLLAALLERLKWIPASYRYDLVLFQREMISTLVTLEPLFRRPRVLDVDDALWLHHRGPHALRLARMCDVIICGNQFLADYFSGSKRTVVVLPTAVDTVRFAPAPARIPSQVIGWSGTSSNLRSLESLDIALAEVLRRFPQARLRVICNQPPRFERVPHERVEYIRWTAEGEVGGLRDMSVGLMPLPDSDWSRGKCAFKMLTYMACGVPVVVSPIGMNVEVLAKAEIGYGVRTIDEWVDAISKLLSNIELARRLGANGRTVVESGYSREVLAKEFAKILRNAI